MARAPRHGDALAREHPRWQWGVLPLTRIEQVKPLGVQSPVATLEFELELLRRSNSISDGTEKPVLRGARALRERSVSRGEVWASAGVQGAWVSGCGCEAD